MIVRTDPGPAGSLIAAERLYLDATKTRVVAHGHRDAAFLLAVEGGRVPVEHEEAVRVALDLAEINAVVDASTVATGDSTPTPPDPPERKQAPAAPNKQATKPPNKGGSGPRNKQTSTARNGRVDSGSRNGQGDPPE